MTALVPSPLELEQARSLAAVGSMLRDAASPLGYDRLLVFATRTWLERDAAMACTDCRYRSSARPVWKARSASPAPRLMRLPAHARNWMLLQAQHSELHAVWPNRPSRSRDER